MLFSIVLGNFVWFQAIVLAQNAQPDTPLVTVRVFPVNNGVYLGVEPNFPLENIQPNTLWSETIEALRSFACGQTPWSASAQRQLVTCPVSAYAMSMEKSDASIQQMQTLNSKQSGSQSNPFSMTPDLRGARVASMPRLRKRQDSFSGRTFDALDPYRHQQMHQPGADTAKSQGYPHASSGQPSPLLIRLMQVLRKSGSGVQIWQQDQNSFKFTIASMMR